MNSNTDIAIVGMSCFFPGAKNINDFWNNLINSIDSTSEVPKDRIDPVYFQKTPEASNHFYCHKGGFVPDISFDAKHFRISDSLIKKLDPSYLLCLKLVYRALEDAQVLKKGISLKKSSLIIGKGSYTDYQELRLINAVQTGEQITEVIKTIFPELSEEDILKVKSAFQKDKEIIPDSGEKFIPRQMAPIIARELNIEGSVYTVDASCASSLVAVEHAVQQLLNENSDIAIAGGIHFSQNPSFWSIFNQQGLLSHKQQSSPFSEDADGFLISEGAGFIVLKKLEKALSDHDKIYAVIKGTGVSNNQADLVTGQKKAILNAWKKTGITPANVNYIEAHGSAIKTEDQAELTAISEVFKEHTSEILIGSVKSNIGHTMSAAGIAGLIKTALLLHNRQIPPTLHCEKPLKETGKRFIPVQKTIDWKESDAPFLAGVNAFGLDGVNAHIVMQAYGKKNTSSVQSVFEEEVIAVTASSKDALLEALEQGNFSFNNEDSYRLVLFNPTADRIEKAKKLISKDKNWKGRQDIWFSNKPLLQDKNTKVAFLFPGFDPASDPEIESIADYFGYSIPKEIPQENAMLSHASKQFHRGEIIDGSLKKLGVVPDLNAGHSLGEWFAAKAGGLISNTTVDNLIQSIQPDKFEIDDVYFIAAGCGIEKLNPWIEKIPDLYVSNDNCPNQVLLCGTVAARDQIIEVLKSEQVFHQVLNFQSGFHSPFLKNNLYLFEKGLEHIKVEKNEIPVWSATTLEQYPTNLKEFKELTIKHLLETVRFRELIEKLYEQEKTRVFIQIGSGSLIGFVDDTFKDKEYSAISAYVINRSTLEQIRRVLALLFIEGKSIDTSFLGIKEERQTFHNEIQLSMNSSLVKDIPLLKELSQKYAAHSTESESFDSLFIKSNHPVIQAMNDNMRELISMQKEFSEIVQKKKALTNNYSLPDTEIIDPKEDSSQFQQPIISKAESVTTKKGTSFEEDLYVSIEDHPYLIDHSLMKQPKHWTVLDDINPVIPMTMTLELLIEAAQKQDPSKKVLQLGPVSVFQWMKVSTPFHQKIEGAWKTEDKISLKIKNFLTGEVTLGNSYSNPESEYLKEIDFGENLVTIPTPEVIYKDHMFHGPGYQGIVEVTNVTKKGLHGIIKKSTGKGSLLDNIGQLYGLYLQLTLGEDSSVSFPVKIEEINFYQDVHDQQGTFECICLPTSLTDKIATADIIIKRDNKIWCIIKGWKNQIFEGFDRKLWNVTMNPSENILAREITPDIHFFDNAYSKAVNWDFLSGIYLNQEEKHHYETLMLNKKKDFLISRIALKDTIRKYINKHFGKKYYPIEFNLQYDANHKPSIHGVPETQGIEISLAHKGSNSVSIVSDKPVGIDIEIIEERDKGFLNLTFTEKELNLLKDKDLAEWSTRFWTAKEAYSKMLGVGLKGSPKQYEIESIDGEQIKIKDTVITTIKYNINFIIGWTL